MFGVQLPQGAMKILPSCDVTVSFLHEFSNFFFGGILVNEQSAQLSDILVHSCVIYLGRCGACAWTPLVRFPRLTRMKCT